MSTARRPIVPALALVAVVVVVVLILSGGSDDKTLHARFASATNLTVGAKVLVADVQVGTVKDITLVKAGVVDVKIGISNKKVWPLHQGTKARIRFGGTVSYSNRFIQLTPGPAQAKTLENGASLPLTDTVTPVEFDDLFNVFDKSARHNLGKLVDTGANTFGDRAAAMRAGLKATAPALDATADTLQKLGDDPQAVRTLLSAGAATAAALHDKQTQLVQLVEGAGKTFTAISDHARATQATLDRLPRTLTIARDTLKRTDPSLTKLDALITDLKPGASALHTLAQPLGRAITTLGVVAPQLNRTLATTQRAAPTVSKFLDTAAPVLTATKPALTELVPISKCARLYTPELGGLIETWRGLAPLYDAQGRIARPLVQALPFPNGTTAGSPKNVMDTVSPLGINYAFVRPPGYGVNHSTFDADCGATQNALKAEFDPEPLH